MSIDFVAYATDALEDPVPKYTQRKRKEECAIFWYNNKFVYTTANTTERQSTKSEVPHKSGMTYEDYRISKEVTQYEIEIKAPVEAKMNVVLCGRDAERDYYLTFAFRRDHYVILTVPQGSEIEAAKNVEFHALIQPDGKIDEQLTSEPLYFAHAFWGHSIFQGFDENRELNVALVNIFAA